MGTERDWTTFLYSLSSPSSGIGLKDVLSIYRRTKDRTLTPASPEPEAAIFRDKFIFWEDDPAREHFGFLNGAERKWGEDSDEVDDVRRAGRIHGVSEEVP